MNKLRDNHSNWREQLQRLEEDILKVVVRYTVQEDETDRGKLGVEREKELVEGPME
jgi:septum formation topological specificity factor MinE